MLTIYKASAGSGKTYTLAYEYIKLLLGVRPEGHAGYVLNDAATLRPLGLAPVRRPHSHILAITFSNKATAEMKTRIIRELHALGREPAADGRDAPYAAALMAELGCTREALQRTARRALHELIHDYSSFNVSTIDSFFQKVLRAFAREIDRQGDYRVELDADYVTGSALSLLFDELNYGDDPGQRRVLDWLHSRAADNARDGHDFNPFSRTGGMYRDLIRAVNTTFEDQFGHHARDIREYLADPSRIEALGRELRRRVDELNESMYAITQAVLARVDTATLTANMRKLLEKVTPGEGLPDTGTTVTGLIFPTSAYLTCLRDHVAEKCYTAKAAAPDYGALFDWRDRMVEALVWRHFCTRLAESLNGLAALGYIDRYVTRFRIENNLILISDTNSLLRTIISDDETPFIYERIGQPLQHFLIDEFQDTSRMQWGNLRPLVANSLAETHDSLIIGDVKQSIYRWRGAESSLLDSEVESDDFPRDSNVRGAAPGENTNYRSAHGIVRFNNTLFARMAAQAGVRGYGGVEQSLPAATAALTSHITVTDLTGLPDERETALRILAQRLLDAHARGYRWNQMAVICRRRKIIAQVVDYLMRNHPEISVMSDDALLVRNASSVKLIIGMLELMDKTCQGKTAAADGAHRTPDDPNPAYRSRSDSEILIDRFEYFLSHGSAADEALRLAMDISESAAPGQSEGIGDDLAAIRELAPANLVALVEAIIDRKVSPERRQAELPYITAFMDTVTQFTNSYNPSVHAFLEYWNLKSDRITIGSGEGQDAVTVTTVHTAKGLEWDIVCIPMMDWELEAQPTEQWFELDGVDGIDPALVPGMIYYSPSRLDTLEPNPIAAQVRARVAADTADNLNVLYVAFTRAARELHICVVTPTTRASHPAAPAMLAALAAPLSQDERTDIYIDLAAGMGEEGLSIGEPTAPVRKAAVGAPVCEAPVYRVNFSTLARRIARLDDLTTTDNALDPDISEDMAASAVTDMVTPSSSDAQREAARRGMALHAILARMRTLDDLDDALEREATGDDGERQLYRDTLISAFRAHDGLTARWFDPDAPRVMVEQPIYAGERDENFRPDRIVWCTDGHVDIVDYKFTSEEHPEHISQVRGYVGLLRSMHIDNVRGYVWYPAMRRVVEVSV